MAARRASLILARRLLPDAASFAASFARESELHVLHQQAPLGLAALLRDSYNYNCPFRQGTYMLPH